MIKIYSASAGTGKTHRLTLEFLKIIIQKPYHYKRILAVTFTIKAAVEMKHRVMKELASITVENEASTMLTQLKEELPLTEKQIRENAKKALRLILYDYSALSIMTIDGYNVKLLGFLGHITGNNHYTWELSYDQYLENLSYTLFETGTLSPEYKKVIAAWFRYKRKLGNWDIKQELNELLRYVLGDAHHLRFREIRAWTTRLQKVLPEMQIKIEDYLKKMEAVASKIESVMEKYVMAPEDFPYKEFYKYVTKKLKSKDPFEFELSEENNKRLYKNLHEDKWYKATCDREAIAEIWQIYETELQDVLSENETQKVYEVIHKNLYPLSLVNLCAELLERQKENDQKFFVSDVNKRIFEQVKDEPVPYIYYQSGTSYDHLFIDEFQDTSALQWENIQPLKEEILSKENRQHGSQVLLVGDVKQAIYRFRGGTPDQMLELLEKSREPQSQIQVAHLTKNFRSSKEIVTFNNRLFSYFSKALLPENSQAASTYASGNQSEYLKENGFLSLQFTRPAPKGDSEQCSETMQQFLEKTIRDLTENKNFKHKDIAILVRDNKTAKNISQFLTKRNIENISAQSFLIDKHPLVQIITAFFEMLETPTAKGAYFTLLKNFLYLKHPGEPLEAKHFEHEAPPKNPVDFLRAAPFCVTETLHTTGSLYPMAEGLIRALRLTEHLDDVSLQFLNLLLQNNDRWSISDYLDDRSLRKDKKTLSNESLELDAVNILTYHKAKGLEFKAVLLPDLKFSNALKNDWLWMDLPQEVLPLSPLPVRFTKINVGQIKLPSVKAQVKKWTLDQTLEALNLMYVAMTRAENHLYASIPIPEKLSSEAVDFAECWAGFIQKETDHPISYETPCTFGTSQSLPLAPQHHTKNTTYFCPSPSSPPKIVLTPVKKESLFQQKGTLIHKALQFIRSPKRRANFLSNPLEPIAMETQTRISNIVKRLQEHAVLSEYYRSDRCFIEREIVSSEGKTYRPDYMAIVGHTLAIIDYKTGAPQDDHKHQLDTYGGIVSGLFPHCEIKNILIYLEEEHPEPILWTYKK